MKKMKDKKHMVIFICKHFRNHIQQILANMLQRVSQLLKAIFQRPGTVVKEL